jgi:hypothetical protein
LLCDLDSLSHRTHALEHLGRREDADVATDLFRAIRAAGRLGTLVSRRFASSSLTATTHLPLLLSQRNNIWSVQRGLDGADAVLLAELDLMLSQAGVRPPTALVLVGADHCYAASVGALREEGIPTWLLVPQAQTAHRLLRNAGTAVTRL